MNTSASSSQLLRLAVVGVGKLGEFHTKLLKELCSERRDVVFAGVYDANPTRRDEIAKTYKVPSLASLDAVAEHADAAIIAATTSFHYSIAKTLLEKKRHLFIEKPITATLAEADELLALEEKHGVKIQVGHIERFNPAIHSAEPLLGTPVFIAAERLSGFSKRVTDVSVILDMMIHDIDLILALVKSEVVQISASGVSVFSKELDIANARLEFENGAVATVTASRISRSKVRKMRFFCKDPNSYGSLDLNSGKCEIFRIVDEPTASRKPSLKEFATQKIIALFGEIQDALNGKTIDYHSPDPPKINALKMEQESFIDSILYHKPIRVDSAAGRRALDVAGKITAAILKNGL
jgi:predicted dehydrogenase